MDANQWRYRENRLIERIESLRRRKKRVISPRVAHTLTRKLNKLRIVLSKHRRKFPQAAEAC